jgi:hypothetical protein
MYFVEIELAHGAVPWKAADSRHPPKCKEGRELPDRPRKFRVIRKTMKVEQTIQSRGEG